MKWKVAFKIIIFDRRTVLEEQLGHNENIIPRIGIWVWYTVFGPQKQASQCISFLDMIQICLSSTSTSTQILDLLVRSRIKFAEWPAEIKNCLFQWFVPNHQTAILNLHQNFLLYGLMLLYDAILWSMMLKCDHTLQSTMSTTYKCYCEWSIDQLLERISWLAVISIGLEIIFLLISVQCSIARDAVSNRSIDHANSCPLPPPLPPIPSNVKCIELTNPLEVFCCFFLFFFKRPCLNVNLYPILIACL